MANATEEPRVQTSAVDDLIRRGWRMVGMDTERRVCLTKDVRYRSTRTLHCAVGQDGDIQGITE